MANCGCDELTYLHNACEEELKAEYNILQKILRIDEIENTVMYEFLSDYELELVREIASRFVVHNYA